MLTVSLTWTADRKPTDDALLRLCEQHGAAASLDPKGRRVHATLTLDEVNDPATALEAAVDYVTGIVPGHLDAVEVLTIAEHDRRLAEPAFPELVGVAELAEILDVTTKRASAIQTRHDFPAPVARLRSGPVWRRGDITTFESTWDRKPGRPRKATA